MDRYMEIVRNFDIKGEIKEITAYGNGLINNTLKISTEGTAPDYILQRINTGVFKDVDVLQRNIEAVTKHLRKKEEAETPENRKKVLEFVKSLDGNTYWRNTEDGSCWRMMVFIPDTITIDTMTPENAYKAGLAISDFHCKLSDITEKIGESIPDFHNISFRLRQFEEAVAEDPCARAASVRDLISGIAQRAEYMTSADRLHKEGLLPKRICHCDTKLNNFLFDKDGNIVAVIDLDTVMPSYIFSDYGDFLRTAANATTEDDPDTSNIRFRHDIYTAFTEGYLEGAEPFITDIEKEMLPYAVKLFPYMQCVRFLTDYLNGDTYYRTSYPEHNLVRAINQMTLLEKIEEAMPNPHM